MPLPFSQNIEQEYKNILESLNKRGAAARDIEAQLRKRDEELQKIIESIKPYRKALQKIENTRMKALQLVEDIRIPLPL